MSDFRIINLGLPKTGTTTLTRALRRASISVADWKVRKRQTSDESLHGKHLGTLMYRDYFDHGDPLKRLHMFRAFNELSHAGLKHSLWPQTDWAFLEAIQKHHPYTKFLLNYRDPAKTANSIMRWTNLGTMRLPLANVPGLPKGYGDEGHIARWVAGHYAFVRRVFAGADNFLEFDITDAAAPKKIGAFIGTDLPWWGRANANAQVKPAAAAQPDTQPELTDH